MWIQCNSGDDGDFMINFDHVSMIAQREHGCLVVIDGAHHIVSESYDHLKARLESMARATRNLSPC